MSCIWFASVSTVVVVEQLLVFAVEEELVAVVAGAALGCEGDFSQGCGSDHGHQTMEHP